MTTALIVEDEPLLAAELAEELGRLWPELTLLEPVHDGVSALRESEARRPDVLFLDVQMPGLTEIEAARVAGARSHRLHHRVRPVRGPGLRAGRGRLPAEADRDRAPGAGSRTRACAPATTPPVDLSTPLEPLQRGNGSERLQWITVLQGRDIQFIAVDDVCYFRADNKYIAVVTATGESLITTSLKELVARLDATIFWQVHRGVVVNMRAVQSVRRSITGQLDLRLKSRPETLRVSAGYEHLFKRM